MDKVTRNTLFYLYGQASILSPKIIIGIFDDYNLMLDVKSQFEDKIPHVYWDEIELNKIQSEITKALGGA